MQNSYISGYGKILSRIWNGAEGLLCLVGGHDINPPVHAISVHCTRFSSTVSLHTLGEFAPQRVNLEMLMLRDSSSLQGATTECQRRIPETVGTKGLDLWISPHSWSGEGTLEEPI